MTEPAPTTPVRRVLVTGVSGNLGRRLAPLLSDYEVVSVDLHPPPADVCVEKFFQLDLSQPTGQEELARIVADRRVEAVLHLAFVIDPIRTGIVDEAPMWQANVAATQHLLDAIARTNRDSLRVRLFAFPSSVSAYGPNLPLQVREDAPLRAHTLPYAVHKREADEICQRAHPKLGGCAVYIYRPHIYVGRSVDNYILRAIRGQPSGRGWLARAIQNRGWKIPVLVPRSAEGRNLFQFVHIDDVVRVLLWTLRNFRAGQLEIFNLAGRGESIAFHECTKLAGTPVLRLPSRKVVELLLRFFWSIGLSGVPPQALPYFLGSYTMDTTHLQEAVGHEYERIVHFTTRDALLDALRS